jgi:hypothetical protein
MHTKMSIFSLFMVSAMFGIMSVGLIIIDAAHGDTRSLGLVSPMFCAALIGTTAASALVSLHKRVSELERQGASNDRKSGER